LVSDTNPIAKVVCGGSPEPETAVKLERTSMSFITVAALSFRNLLTKKGRVVITSIARSVGIMSIALVLRVYDRYAG